MGFDFPNDFGKSNPIVRIKYFFVFVRVNYSQMIRGI